MVVRRQSKMRQVVYDTVVEHPVHPTAEYVYEKLKPQYPSLSLGTVYRNLGVLVEQGLIRKIESLDAADRFDGNMEPHSHVQCSVCGSLQDIFLSYDKGLDAAANRESGYAITEHNISFVGICPDCQRMQASD
ncbi:MAG: transcriptional repressor [Oscillospiraceae bacterium]|nr:transcriptional repressor [Oscillospiraceae bacterium]